MILVTNKLMETMMVNDYGSKAGRVKIQKGSEKSVGKKRKEGGTRRF